jgi:hypothetical protein
VPRFVQVIFTGFESSSHDSLRFSFSDLHQIFRQHLAFGGFGSQVGQFEGRGLAVLDVVVVDISSLLLSMA